ncbi:MAG: hypothetical protein Q4G68_08135 [Planctomycetia bacterium]|nr:hypothetical protein [Planctomycetia bacterium]
MFRTNSFWTLTLAVAMTAGSTTLVAQDATNAPAAAPAAEARPDDLSIDSLAPVAEPLDMSLFAIPENASAEELLKFIEELQGKLPEPKSQMEMLQLMEALTKTFSDVADRILAMENVAPEVREQATQLKVVALTAKSRIEPKAVEELSAFVDSLLAEAKDTEAKIKAYQLKLQVLVSGAQGDPTVLDKVDALAAEILKNEDEELQILGMEVKAQTLLSKGQSDPAAYDALQKFAEETIAANKSAKLVEKAQEVKLLAMLAAADKDEANVAALDAYFEELFAKELSAESKSNIYRLRLQTLMQGENPDVAKTMAVAERMIQEDDAELKNLGQAVKGQMLIKEAQADASKLDAVFAFADELLAQADLSAEAKEQAVGSKIQAYLLKSQAEPAAREELLAFLDEQLAAEQTEEFLGRLAEMKVQLLLNAAAENAEKIPDVEKALEQLSEIATVKENLDSTKALLAMLKIENLAKTNGTVEELNAVLDSLKQAASASPVVLNIVLQLQDDIATIGENAGTPDLYSKVLADFIAFCNASENEEIKAFASQFQGVLDLESLPGKDLALAGVVAGETPDQKFDNASVAGKVYLVDVWSTNDPSYFESIEDLKDLYSRYQPKGFEIVGVNLDENTQMLTRAAEVFATTWPIISKKLSDDAGVELPAVLANAKPGTKILVGQDGKVMLIASDLTAVEDGIASVLGKVEKQAPAEEPAADNAAAESAESAAAEAAADEAAPAPAKVKEPVRKN